MAIKITEELLYDNAFNLEGYIIDQFGRAMANAEEDAFLNGDGTGKPLGLFAESGGGTVAQTLTAAIKSDDVLDLIYALKRPYRKNAKFIMNDRTLLSLRKLKDNNGNYMWQPSYQAGEPDKLLGYSIFTSAYAPAAAIAFGDMSYYNIGDRGTRSIAELRELFAGNGMYAAGAAALAMAAPFVAGIGAAVTAAAPFIAAITVIASGLYALWSSGMEFL